MSLPMDTSVTPVDPEDRVTYRQLLSIYQEAIEPSEQKPADAIAAMLRDKRYSVIVSRTGADVTGLAMAFFPENGDFWLLEYVAVDTQLRSRGIGDVLFREVLSVAKSRIGNYPCILEVDQLGAAVSISNDLEKRMRFYARQGCRRLDGLSYILPLDVAGTPPSMYLLVHGLNGQNKVPKLLVRSWLSSIYSEVYECIHDDPRIEMMLKQLGPTIELSRYSLAILV
jgi:GNAT superfamily N-acetyltransferase